MSDTLQSDDQDFEHAVAHAQMMWRQAYKQECARRHADMEWNEAQANEALAAGIKQDRIDEQRYQVKLANDAEQQRKYQKNVDFWQSIKNVVIAILLAALAVYLLIHWG